MTSKSIWGRSYFMSRQLKRKRLVKLFYSKNWNLWAWSKEAKSKRSRQRYVFFRLSRDPHCSCTCLWLYKRESLLLHRSCVCLPRLFFLLIIWVSSTHIAYSHHTYHVCESLRLELCQATDWLTERRFFVVVVVNGSFVRSSSFVPDTPEIRLDYDWDVCDLHTRILK